MSTEASVSPVLTRARLVRFTLRYGIRLLSRITTQLTCRRYAFSPKPSVVPRLV